MKDELREDLKKVAAKYGSRIYEYTGTDGVVYWSFTKHQRMISPPLKLILNDRLGKHVLNFLVELRKMSDEFRKE